MRYLGVDYGRRRIGLALSDPTGLIASPFQIIENKGFKKTSTQILTIIQQNNIGGIVVGLPLHANGDESEMSGEARRFGQIFIDSGIPVTFVDERYTSCEAEMILNQGMRRERQKKYIDKVAASLILQVYLDERRKTGHES